MIKKIGFGVRQQYNNKKVDDSCRFVCCKESHRAVDKRLVKKPMAETRTSCKSRISLTLKNGKFVIHDFVEAHNYLLQLPETTHMLASHRKISKAQEYEIEMAENSKRIHFNL
ncbi:hypothetical protein L6164_023654 [Bauhinia variegata]|uniref:Uncharacterized protein n=1 Tax=Bauhinia variegata TaxID=167791 RepID=A0ACB9MJR1_BAUVA|nr:hypothetical protein L6164_023654 [Bauhinia variegata]